MGTTLTVVTLCEGVLKVGHVGDSRAYLIRADSIVQLTDDHSVVGELLRSGLLTPEEAECHPGRHAITRALGFSENLDIDNRRTPAHARGMPYCSALTDCTTLFQMMR